MTMTLEQQARELWRSWGVYAKATFCHGCARMTNCRARRTRGPWLCLPCFDTSTESDRQLRQKGPL